MQDLLVQDESAWRLGTFVVLLAAFALWEVVDPRRLRALGRQGRWITNLSIGVLNSLVLRFLFPLLAVDMALLAADRGWGVLNWIDGPFWVEFVAALIILDFAIYGQHVLTHYWTPLWRLHRVHHADRDVDVTTAIRFHPIEIAFSMLLKMAVVIMLGPAAIAVMVFEIVLNGTSMFNHANIRLPNNIDRVLRLFLVTPDMHRVHHSVNEFETNSNFGFNLSVWDRICGTYRAQPEAGHDGMSIGLPQYRDENPARLLWSLALPFQAVNLRDSEGEGTAQSGSGSLPGGTRKSP